jgi:hypothetical protein
MEHKRNLSRREINDEASRRSRKCAEILTRWFAKWLAVFPNHPITKMQTAVYLEALSDLSPDQLEMACLAATQRAEQFPKPGHIRNAVQIDRSGEFLGPPLLEYPEISQEERDAAVAECRAQLGPEWARSLRKMDGRASIARPRDIPKKIPVRPSGLSVSQQKEILKSRGFLK